MFIVAVCVSGNLYQLCIFIFFRCINGIFYRNCLICVSMNQKHRLFIFADRLVYIQKLCCAEIIAAQMPVPPFHHIRNMLRIKRLTKQIPFSRTIRDYNCRRHRNRRLKIIRPHSCCQHGKQSALGMSADIKVCHKIQRLCIIRYSHGIIDPLHQIMLFKGTTAFSMSVQFDAQCRKPDFIHCAGNSSDVPFLHIAG